MLRAYTYDDTIIHNQQLRRGVFSVTNQQRRVFKVINIGATQRIVEYFKSSLFRLNVFERRQYSNGEKKTLVRFVGVHDVQMCFRARVHFQFTTNT